MDLTIEIDHQDVGFQYSKIKSLLGKFRQIETHKDVLENLNVELQIEKSEFHELSGALIWRLAKHYQSLPCTKTLKYSDRIEKLLKSRHFLDGLTGKRSPDNLSQNVPVHFESFTPVRNMKPGYKGAGAEAVYKNAIKTILDPRNEFHGEVSANVLEIINNAFDHSEYEKEAGIVCVKEEGSTLLSVCVVDMGQGIRSSLISNPLLRSDFLGIPEDEVIKQVTKYKVSCNPQEAKHPNYLTSNGGIGLYFLKLLAAMHKNGQLILLSGKGYYYVDGEGREIKRSLISERWPGTLVFFRVDLNQDMNPEYRDYIQHDA